MVSPAMQAECENPPAVELRSITKRFGPVIANAGIDLRVRSGTIHGIVGENGAGKSTAMHILFGLARPDSGEVWVKGRPCRFRSAREAIAGGLGMVHQHFMLAGPGSALDNIILGAETVRHGIIDRAGARTRLEALARQHGLPVEWDKPVEAMPVGFQQRIEILKLLYREADILILDEPTAVLTPDESARLFANLRSLRDRGKTILLITHKLAEVMALTDRVTVFRAGKVVGEKQTSRTTIRELADLMFGRRVALEQAVAPARVSAKAALEVSGLNLAGAAGGRGRLTEINFQVGAGEIVGIAGVEGNGQSELLECILRPRGLPGLRFQSIKVAGRDVSHMSPRKIRALGVSVIPQDRLREGLLPERPLWENFLLGWQRQESFCSRGVLALSAVWTAAAETLARYAIRTPHLQLSALALSGGNQQKLIVARELYRLPRLLVAAQPTRGVDLGAVDFIHSEILRTREAGAGVLMVSSDLDEVLKLSDRLLVMFGGRIVAEYARGSVSEKELGLKMGGAV